MINVPNVVTVSRVVLALGTLGVVCASSSSQDDTMRYVAFWLTAFVIYADALDGYFARKLNQASKFGGILDIAGDRAVEMAYWIVYATLQWIPVWVPLLYLVRGTFVDAVRTFASEQGYTAFGAKTMMQSALGKFLVASNFSRFTYAVAKAVAFCLLILAHTKLGADFAWLSPLAMWCVWIACIFCVLRGLPVLFEAGFVFKNEKSN